MWNIGMVEYWNVEWWNIGMWDGGILEYWNGGILEWWNVGMWNGGMWNIGMWNIGKMEWWMEGRLGMRIFRILDLLVLLWSVVSV